MKLLPALLKAARTTRRGRPLSALLTVQQALLSPAIKTPAKRRAKPAIKTPAPRVAAKPARPAPGSFVTGHFTCPHGRRDYRLYTPTVANGALPLVVMLHGCTQDSADFAIATNMNRVAEEHGFSVLYPEQPRAANAGRCWNWHRPEDQARGGGEPALIAALTRRIMRTSGVDPARVYIAGHSAGGAAAAVVAAAYPDLFAAVGVHSGVARGLASTVGGALHTMRHGGGIGAGGDGGRHVPLILFHGDQDKVVHPANSDAFFAPLRRARPALVEQTQAGRSAGGRDVTRTILSDAKGVVLVENWTLHGGGHGWSGGRAGAAHTEPDGPDASREMARFFLERRRAVRKRAA